MDLYEQKKLMGIVPRDPWGLTESIVTTLNQQWHANAPKVVTAKGKKYTFNPKFTMQKGPMTVMFQYTAKKGPDDVMPPKCIFTVEYNRGADLYDVKIEVWNGDMTKVGEREVAGLMFDQFDNFKFGDVLRG